MRTFTYLNLYGYLTDAVVVNRVLPEAAGDGYFAAWREAQQGQMELVQSAFAPVPILTAPHLPREVIGAGMLDQLGDALYGQTVAEGVLHETLSQELSAEGEQATLRLALPFAERGDIELKKIASEVIVKVAGQKRTIILPPAMAAYETEGASFHDGALEVRFHRSRHGAPQSHPPLTRPTATRPGTTSPTSAMEVRRRPRRRGAPDWTSQRCSCSWTPCAALRRPSSRSA